MCALPSPDVVIPKALIGKDILPPNPVKGSVESMALGIIQRAEEGNWAQGMELAKKNPIEQRKIDERVEQIGITRDASGNKTRPGAEATRYTEAKTAAALNKAFLDKGYDNLTAPQKAQLHLIVEREIQARPALFAEYDKLSDPEKLEYVDKILKNPKFSEHARTIFGEILDPQKQLADAVTPAQDAYEEAQLSHNDKQAEVNDVTRRSTNVDAQLKDYERTSTTKGAKATQLDNLRADLPTTETELKTWKQKLEDAKQRLTDLTAERDATLRYGGGTSGRRVIGDINTDMGAVRSEIKTAETGVDTRQAKVEQVKQLELDERGLEQRKQELDQEKRTKNTELDKLKRQMNRRKQEFEDAKTLRASQEQDLADSFKGIVGEATNELLNEQVGQLNEAFTKELEVLKQQTQDQNEKALYDSLQKRWTEEKTKKTGLFWTRREVKIHPIKKEAVDRDYNQLMSTGPEAVMQEILTHTINPATGANYTTAEAAGLLADKKYVEKMQPEVVKHLLAKRIMSGTMNQDDIQIIATSQWGQGMIQKAIETRNDVRKAVEDVMGAGALEKKGFWGRFVQEMKTHPQWLFLLVLGLPLLAGISASGGGGAETAEH